VLGAHWHEMRAEAISTKSQMTFVGDRRVDQRSWAVLPMRVEPDDRPIFGDDACAKNRTLAPRTVTLIEALGPPEAYSFSSLAAGATIAEHRHEVINGGSEPRIVLLVLVEPRR
jgi:hypothetical protein